MQVTTCKHVLVVRGGVNMARVERYLTRTCPNNEPA